MHSTVNAKNGRAIQKVAEKENKTSKTYLKWKKRL